MTEKGRIYHEEMLQRAAKEQSRKAAKSTSPGKSKSYSGIQANDAAKDSMSTKQTSYSATVGHDEGSLSASKKYHKPSEETFDIAVKQLQNQLSTIDRALDTSDINLVKDESRKLDKILPDVIDANSKLLETMDNNQMSKQSKLIQGIEQDAFTKKQDICEWLAQHNEQRSTRSSHRKSTSIINEVKVPYSSKAQSVNIGANLLTIVNSSKDRLSRQVDLMNDVLATDDVDMIKRESTNLDRVLANLVDAHSRLMEVIDGEQSESQAKWMEQIDAEVFHIKQQVCTQLIQHNERASSQSSRSSRSSKKNKEPSDTASSSKSRSSKDSAHSRSSKTSMVEQKAITASLQAKANILKNTMTEVMESEARRKQEKIKHNISKINVEIAKSQAKEGVYESDIQNTHHNHKQFYKENASSRPDKAKSVKKKETSQRLEESANASSKHISEISKDMVRMLKAPAAEIDTFTGNPLEYQYFRSVFKESVEKVIDDQRGRLTRLIKYTSGEAKELVKPFVHADPSNCYDKAIEMLDAEFGSSHTITCAYLKQLEEWPSIKVTDTVSFRRLYRFLLQCKTYKTKERLQELDSSSTLKNIIQKLHTSYQDNWSITAEKRRRAGRSVTFDDLVYFIDFHSSRATDPAYSRGAMSGEKEKNPPLKGFNSKLKVNDDNNKRSVELKTNDDVIKDTCPLCQKGHHLESCLSYLSKDPNERNKTVFDLKLCFKCLKPTTPKHYARVCINRDTCNICDKLHPTSLHDPNKGKKTETTSEEEPTKISSCSVQHKCEVGSSISLCIVPVFVKHKDYPERELLVYAMIDNDCTGCFITKETVDLLAPEETRKACITIETINCTTEQYTTAVNGLSVRCSVKHESSYPCPAISLPTTFGFDGLPLNKDEIPTPSNLKHWDYLEKLCSIIPEYDNNIPFGLMIGGNCPKALEPLEVITSQGDGPYAYRTRLGWCVVGPLAVESSSESKDKVQCHRTAITQYTTKFPVKDLISGEIAEHHFASAGQIKDTFTDKLLTEMYNLEFNEINGEEEAPSKDDDKFMAIMSERAVKVDGHYELPLPFKDNNVSLPNNRKQIEKRLLSVKRKMERSVTYRDEYTSCIEALIDKGYAQKCTNDEHNKKDGRVWYLPHHGVYHPTKGKLRVVFDCGATYQGVSLNDKLLQGPDLTNQLVGVLIRFRKHTVPVMADIEAMFHQVRVTEEHRSFLRFLWWPGGDVSLKPEVYEMCVHTFGTISSPSCANFALRKTAKDNKEMYGDDASDTLLRDFYVDDMLKSLDEDEEAVSLMSRVQQICKEGGFNLTKFISNSPAVIESIPVEKRAASLQEFELLKKLPIERALGVMWSVENDTFGFRISIHEDQPLTRRNILSSISSIYDPCGLASPFLLKGRKILQEITADKGGWDDPVPAKHAQSWIEWKSSLHLLESITVNRCLKPDGFGKITDVSLHCFSDASFFGYGQATYIRYVNQNKEVAVSLVMAKSRVSPLKPTTVPRLELTAALLSCNVGALVKSELQIAQLHETYWIDNMVALGYILNDTRRFRIYVANRTRKIRDQTEKEQWRYISTNENPADDSSRGLSVTDEDKVHRWFNGPQFLHLPEDQWPETVEVGAIPSNDPEVKVEVKVNALVTKDCSLLTTIEERISDWHRQKCVLAMMLRFVKKCSKQSLPVELTAAELQDAESFLLKMIQQKYLGHEIESLKTGKQPKSSALAKLQPYIDIKGVLRVGGRISNSDLEDKLKHPVILPKKGSHRIIEWHHKNMQHSGRTSTVNELRANGLWLLSVNSQVRKVIFNCTRCRLLRGKLGEQQMANLPTNRMLTEAPFTYCGVDMFGPFYIKEGRKELKRYGAIFTCFSLRAIHIETTVNIDTDSFIQALRRFINRRGTVRSIRSDNGGNFVGCANEFSRELKNMDNGQISKFLLSKDCDWIVWENNPPVSSHTGGVWERMIKSIRGVFNSLLKDHPGRLNDESLRTLMTEAEAIVNSRPLTTENLQDPESLPITPNQLLTMKSKVALPPPGIFQKEDMYCRKRWKSVQYLANEFWRRWKKEYLIIMQDRQKWQEKKRNFLVGDIVLVKEEDLPRNQWKTGRIMEVIVSKDGLVRVANIRLTPCGTVLQRSITKFVLLIGIDEDQ